MEKYIVIGNPIDHSLSPDLHNYWIKKNNINAIYEKKKLNEIDIENTILQIKKGEIKGLNVTVPFKKLIIPFLDSLSASADETQSVNTVYIQNNKIIGHNTDIGGFELAIKKIGYNVKNKKVFILGAGGVAPSIIVALKKMGSSQIYLTNRTIQKADNLNKIFPYIKILKWGETPDFDMIINATSLGLKKDDKINLDFNAFGSKKLFYDVIYNPSETNFLSKGKEMGNQIENGKMMFIYQAQQAFTIWHKIVVPIDPETINLLNT
jgi:shikimate dehydrogenase